MYQIVYSRTYTPTREIARIKNGRITGSEAESIREILVQRGWPKKKPERILWGAYLFCTLPILEEGDPGYSAD